MDIRILGPVEASVAERPIALRAAKQRAVLAMLALDANHTVSMDRLIEGLWGEHPPASAAKLVQQHISQLRKMLADDGAPIVTRGRGYELMISPDDVDALRFTRLVAQGAGREALTLWRGQALADVADEPFAPDEIRRLDELRLGALEQAVDADLAAGRHLEVAAELAALVTEHPLRERLHAQRMLALYRSGRQADALEVYRQARALLVEQIGVEPGPELRELHAAVLRQDRSLDAPVQAALPSELERGPPLAGRTAELERLRAAWRRARRGRGCTLVLSGIEGIGRTRLAAELAAEVRADGALVLYGEGDVARARAASRPTLLVLDIDVAGPAVMELVSEIATRPALLVVISREVPAAGELPGAEMIELGPLDAVGVGAIAALYAPEGVPPPLAELVERSGGEPGQVHRLAAEWGQREAARQLSAAAERTAAERADLREAEQQLAGRVGALQAVRARSEHLAVARRYIVCPYKGLAPFDGTDAEFFFGRERVVAQLVARLAGASLLAVVGPSGSGKSSVLGAGLLPELARGVLPGSANWEQVVLRPGEHPPAALEQARSGVGSGRAAVIAVDQFEETFTLCRDEEERRAFIDRLLAAAHGRPRSAVVLAVRGDFYARCAAYPALASLMAANQVLVGPMQRDELRRAIELPAQRAGLAVEAELVDRLLAEVEDRPGALPLLSTALLELWQRRDGRDLRVVAYERTGGVAGAVARLAESAYERLDPSQQVLARAIVLRLAGEDASGRAVRRRVALADLDADRDADVRRVLDVLADNRLVTLSEGAAEVAHEALLREWPRLRVWLDEDAEGRRLHQHLAVAAHEWEDRGHDAGDLLRGPRLVASLEWSAEHASELNELERAYVAASRAESEREGHRVRRANRRLRALVAGVAALLALAVIAGTLFLDQRGRARSEATTAQAERLGALGLVDHDLDRSLLLARQGVAIEDTLRTRSNLLAALLRSPAAIGITRFPQRRLLRLALRPDGRALVVGDNKGNVLFLDPVSRRQLRPAYRAATFPILGLAFSPDGSRLAIGAQGTVQLLDGHTWRRIAAPKVPAAEFAALAFSPDSRTLVAITSSTAVGIRPIPGAGLRFDARTGRPLGHPVGLGGPPGSLSDALAFTPDGRSLITASGATVISREQVRVVIDSGDRTITVRDAHTLKPLRQFPGLTFASAVSPDGRTFAIGGDDGSVRFLDLRTGRQQRATGRHEGAVQSAVFTADGHFLVTTGDDGAAILWNVKQAASGEVFRGHAGAVVAAAVDRRARTLYTAGHDGSVITWDLVGDRRLGRPFNAGIGSGDFGPTTAISPDGRTLATVEDNGGDSLVDLRTLTRHDLHISGGPRLGYANYDPAFGPRGTLIVTSINGFTGLADARTGRIRATLHGHHGGVYGPTTSADGRMLATTGLDKTLRLWDAVAARPLGPPIHLPSRAVSNPGISPEGRNVAVPETQPGAVYVFDTHSRRRVAQLRVDDGPPSFSRFSRDGRLLMTGSSDGRVRVFSARDWHPLGPAFPVASGFVTSVDASPDDRTIVTSAIDGQIRLWDLASRRPIGAPLPGPENTNAVALFTPDGNHVYAVFRDGRGYRWDVRPSVWNDHACAVAGRRLSRAEWHELLPGRGYAPAC
jgi:WD40 repeat protein/DNA-binding SARP family transcriptional activator